MKIQIAVFCVVTPSSDVGYRRFGGHCFLHLHGVTTQKTTTWIKIAIYNAQIVIYVTMLEYAF